MRAVTTYTYFIRPYHEPTHDGVQNMLAGPRYGTDFMRLPDVQIPDSIFPSFCVQHHKPHQPESSYVGPAVNYGRQRCIGQHHSQLRGMHFLGWC